MRDQFFAAMHAGNLDEMRRMCEDQRINKERLDVIWQDQAGRRAVHVLASSGNLPMLQFLVRQYRLDLAIPTRVSGDIPLGLAASAGHADVVAYLLVQLERDHLTTSYCSIANNARLSPIQLARQHGHEGVAVQIETHLAQRARHAMADNVDWILAGMQGRLSLKIATSVTSGFSRAIEGHSEGSEWEDVIQTSASVLRGAATVGSMWYMPEYYLGSWALHGMFASLSSLAGIQSPYAKAGVDLLGDLATMSVMAEAQNQQKSPSARPVDGRLRDPVGQGQTESVRPPLMLSEVNRMFRARAEGSDASHHVQAVAHLGDQVRTANTIYLISEPFRVWSYLWGTARHTGFLYDDGEHLWKIELDSFFSGGCSNQFKCIQIPEYRVETGSRSGRWAYELGQTDMTIEQFQTMARDWFASGHGTYKLVADNCRALANHLLSAAFSRDGSRLVCSLWSGFREFLDDPSRYVEYEISRGGGMNVSGRIRAGGNPQATFNVRQAF